MAKGHQDGYQMKGLDLGSKNLLFIFRFSCLFTFYKHIKKVCLHFKNNVIDGRRASINSILVSNERSGLRE
jgi:hypothetical protein